MTIETKLFELRDIATFIPVIASRMHSDNAREHWLLRRAGYSSETSLVLLSSLNGGHAAYDPYEHGGGARTWPAAHAYIEDNWDALESGALIDVRVILGETSQPCETEQT